jgi:SAM-dependent methyltransferase
VSVPTGAEPCPWCGGADAELIGSTPYAEVFDALARTWHVRVSPEVRRAAEPSPATGLLECRSCGLQHFVPMAPGSPAFYAELTAAMPYHRVRWEFDLVRARVRAEDDIVDLGCGEGDFLRSLGSRSGRTVGVDHNIPAVDRLREAGVEAVDDGIMTFAGREAARFDVVTSFHLLEHVPDPQNVISAAARCLRPGGRLFVSVPNRDRAFREPLEPLDFPPHHVSRWAVAQFAHPSVGSELEPAGVAFEPPEMSVVRELVRGRAERLLRWIPHAAMRSTLSRAVAKLAVGPIRHRRRVAHGTYARAGVYGHSMLVEFRRVSVSA